MKNFDEKILDHFEDEPAKPWYQHWSVIFGPVVIFAIGVLFRIQYWPFALHIMATGLLLILFRSLVFFLSKKREAVEWIYFLGRLSLISVLAINFAFQKINRSVLLAALIFFGIGVLFYIMKKKKPEDEHADHPADDY